MQKSFFVIEISKMNVVHTYENDFRCTNSCLCMYFLFQQHIKKRYDDIEKASTLTKGQWFFGRQKSNKQRKLIHTIRTCCCGCSNQQ